LLTDDSVTVAFMRMMGLLDVATAKANVNNMLTHELRPVFRR
jgi:Arc/MetJ family transcription regulator